MPAMAKKSLGAIFFRIFMIHWFGFWGSFVGVLGLVVFGCRIFFYLGCFGLKGVGVSRFSNPKVFRSRVFKV